MPKKKSAHKAAADSKKAQKAISTVPDRGARAGLHPQADPTNAVRQEVARVQRVILDDPSISPVEGARLLAQEWAPVAMTTVYRAMQEAPRWATRLAAATMILDRSMGKAIQPTVDVTKVASDRLKAQAEAILRRRHEAQEAQEAQEASRARGGIYP